MDNYAELRDALMKDMVKKEISYSQAAKMLGISHLTLNSFIAGTREPRLVTVSKILNHLQREGKKVEILIRGTNNEA